MDPIGIVALGFIGVVAILFGVTIWGVIVLKEKWGCHEGEYRHLIGQEHTIP